jgi:hypothetical protein
VIAETRTDSRPAGEVVRARLALADNLRRRREAARQIWRVAPIIAAVALGLAAGSRWAGWPALLALGSLAIGSVGLLLYALVNRRHHAVSDAMAARIDTDAALDGELRSAAWFASRETRDVWADFHLERAATRLGRIDWAGLYPTARAARTQIATIVMALGAIALAVVLPERFGFRAAGSEVATARAAEPAITPAMLDELLSPEMLKQLEALFAAAENAASSPAERAATSAELRALLAQLSQLKDREALMELVRALDPNKDGQTTLSSQEMKALAERAKRTADMKTLPPEIRNALEKLSESLKKTAEGDPSSPKDPSEAVASKDKQPGEAGETSKGANVDEASIQSVKDAGAGAGAGMIMMSNEEAAMGGEPGLGVGGGSAANNGGGRMAAIAQALRHETVEASTDNAGDNVLTDIRRKTEHGDATVNFTHSASGTFDRSRGAAPPAVPEARRQGVSTYFVRKQ